MTKPRLAVPIGPEDHALGSDTAAIQLVEFGDYQCSYCAEAHLVIRELQQQFRDALLFVFRNMPLVNLHPRAEAAAEAAEAAGLQGRFWPMHDLLFMNQSDLSDTALLRYAGQAGADAELVAEDLRTGTTRRRIQADIDDAIRSGVTGTPTFFVNGIRYDGSWELAQFANHLRHELH